jgi:23S rRNA pseudouridine1911/1915/1917 synthase
MKQYYSFIFLLIILLISVLVFLFRKPNIYNDNLKILYQDDDIIVINKPVDIAVHDAPDWDGPTISDTLKYHGHKLYNTSTPFQDGVVHRLDAGTSGILVLAKNEFAYKSLKDQFKNRTVKKIYHALIQGTTEYPNGTIDLPTGLVNGEENIYGVISNGKPSVTHYKTLKVYQGLSIINKASLLEINLETGRTHQIRVHFSHLGNPLVGDPKYGSNQTYNYLIGMNRQWLHAKHFEFDHPTTGKRMDFNTDYPEDLKQSLYLLSNNEI